MSKVEVNDTIPSPLSTVWALVSDFTGFLEVQGVPCTSEGAGIGMTRTITVFGPPLTERLEELDENTHTTSYSIVESALPLTDYQAWIQLTAAGEDSTSIRWWGQFEPTGDDEARVTAMIQGIYEGGIAGLKKALAQ
jgi:hypothetical protein